MPEYDLSGTVAFVTGAARAQGRSHAVQYAEHGADVVVTDICENIETNPYDLGTRNQLEETASMVEDAGGESLLVEMDVSDESQVEVAVNEALDEFGRIDVLTNNAGIYNASELVELGEHQWDEMLDTNLKGVWLCSKHVGKHFVDRGDGGKIVSTTSGLGMHGAYSCGHYGAAKWGVRGLTKTLALELAPHGVTANTVCPTGVETPLIDGIVEGVGQEALERVSAASGPMNVVDEGLLDPEDVAEAVLWLASDAARYVTGVVLPVDAGMTAK